MDEPDQINVDPQLELNRTLVIGLEHVHDGRLVPMLSDGSGSTETPSVEFTTISDRYVCDECATSVALLITDTTDLGGVETVDLLGAVVNAASEGHVPADHRLEKVERPDCPLCVALHALIRYQGVDS